MNRWRLALQRATLCFASLSSDVACLTCFGTRQHRQRVVWLQGYAGHAATLDAAQMHNAAHPNDQLVRNCSAKDVEYLEDR